MKTFSLLVLCAVALIPLTAVLLGLLQLVWRLLVHHAAVIVDFLEFAATNLAFTAFMVAFTGVSLEIRPMPWAQKVQFAGSFLLLYILGKNLAKIRARLAARKQQEN